MEEYFLTTRTKRSAKLWVVQMQRRIWEIAWRLWQDRNETLHGDGNAIHSHEMEAIRGAIQTEWDRGVEDLPACHSDLFRGRLQQRLDATVHAQKMWLASVWLARDNTNSCAVELERRDSVALQFYDRWTSGLGLDL